MIDIRTLTLDDHVYFKDKKHNKNLIIKVDNIETTLDNRAYIIIDVDLEYYKLNDK